MKFGRGFPACLVALAFVGGCAAAAKSPPVSVAEYDRLGKTQSQSYPRQTIVMYNIQRVLDGDLKAEDRVNSMQLVAALGSDDPLVRRNLAALLADPKCPPALFRGVLEYLLKNDYPELAGYVARALPQVGQQGPLRDAVLEWLGKHPEPAVLAEVVKLWAQEPSVTGINEPKFRQVVEKISNKPWDAALLESLNTPDFFARGSAIDILSARMAPTALREQIMKMTARTEAISALQAVSIRFEYMPVSASGLLAVVSIYKTRPDALEDAAKLSRSWSADYGYRFDIRDFHLLASLSRDPLRKLLKRDQLILELGQATDPKNRPHAPWHAGREDRFWPQAEGLSMGDLWNLYLLNEMLARPLVQTSVQLMAEHDRADRSSVWGGLIFYENGRAEARLYPASKEAGENDMIYMPSRTLIVEGRDSLCRFYGHFEALRNARRAGPTAEELQDAKVNDYCGLVLTTLDETSFTAHYYNPQGVVVSLGVFPFRK